MDVQRTLPSICSFGISVNLSFVLVVLCPREVFIFHLGIYIYISPCGYFTVARTFILSPR